MNISLFIIIILFSTPFIFAYGDNMGRLALELEDSPGSGTFTEVWFQQGNQGNSWSQITVDLSSEDNTGQRQLRFVATEVVAGITSDMAVDEITVQGIAISPPQTKDVVSSEDFEAGFTTWINTGGDDNDCWRRNSLETPTSNTGPSTGAVGTTWYVYYESSNGCSPGTSQTAFLLGPTIDFNAFNGIEVKFMRHMWDAPKEGQILDIDFMIYKGDQYKTLGKYETAISIFKEVLKKDQNNVDALNQLGNYYSAIEKFNQAVNWYERVLKVDPDNNIALYGFQKALLEVSSYRTGFLNGILEITVHDHQGKLVAYLQTSEIKFLNHQISKNFVESLPSSKIVNRDNQNYSVYQKEFVKVLDQDSILGFHEFPFSEKMDLPLASTWHYQIPVERGDTVSYVYSFYLPLS